MKIAAVQMVSTPDVAANLAAAARLVAAAAERGAGLVALPEYFCLMGRRDEDKLDIAEAPGRGPIQQALAGLARAHGVWLVGGTLPIAATATGAGDAAKAAGPVMRPARVRNACCVWAPDGSLAARYDKLHLFAFANGRESYDEARVLEPGEAPVAFDATPPSAPGRALRVGLSVCYDLRFPELYRALCSPPCDLLVVPAAFTHTTGQAHWELLLRARAIENQCYVLASAQGGLHDNGRRTWGHSMVVDPWGQVLDVVAEGEGVAIAELDPARLEQVRAQMPALRHRRM